MDILTPRKNSVPPYIGGGPEWVGSITGVRVHCKWRASMSCSIPSQMRGSWYFPRFLFNGGH